MTEVEQIDEINPVEPPEDGSGAKRRFPWAMLAVAAVFIVVPFISWYGTWFGRPLSDSKLEEYLNDEERPRHIQHALDQIVKRMEENDESVKKWYGKIASLSSHRLPEIREWSAVAMGHDNRSDEFHNRLLALLKDDDPIVRRTAALWLVRFQDATGRPELVEMLKPYTLRAECSGVVEVLAGEEGAPAIKGAPLIRIKQDSGETAETRSPVDSRIETLIAADGSRVEAGAELMTLSPGIKQVENALLALSLVGQPEDIAYVQRYSQELPGMPERIRKQASSTADAIRTRVEKR
ncbi:MAG TPA: HEAT repeat domain-containing protein [Blastocatellia bacterium]|nr:HEAT repeat domain-containing protein [Blastocatellia bacterium]